MTTVETTSVGIEALAAEIAANMVTSASGPGAPCANLDRGGALFERPTDLVGDTVGQLLELYPIARPQVAMGVDESGGDHVPVTGDLG